MAAATLAGIPARIASKRETAGMRTAAQEFVEKLAFSRAASIVVNSSAVRDHLIHRSIPADKIALIHNGIDVGRFENISDDLQAVRQKFALPTGDGIRFVTMVANLRHRVKNVPMFLRTAKRVVEQQPDVHFVIAGEGELENDMKVSAKNLGIAENLHFIGRCADVPALLSISYACVLTSSAEGFSNSILEYMAAGKPVVATNVGGAAEAIDDGQTGYLVPTDDDEAMAGQLLHLLDDEKKTSEFGTRGKAAVSERFSVETQLRSTLKLYDLLLSRN